MKIKIDGNGTLFVERSGKYIKQYCPYGQGQMFCGHDCPLFGEPEPVFIEAMGSRMKSTRKSLQICQGRVLTGEVIDERKA